MCGPTGSDRVVWAMAALTAILSTWRDFLPAGTPVSLPCDLHESRPRGIAGPEWADSDIAGLKAKLGCHARKVEANRRRPIGQDRLAGARTQGDGDTAILPHRGQIA